VHEPDRGGARLERRHVVAATIGNALEFYDFLIYALFAIQIGHAFFPTSSAYGSLMLSLATFGAGFATRPIGGIVLGLYADRAGRRPAMMLCLVMIGASITALALIAGNLVGVTLTAILPPVLLDAYGWRIALLLGAAAVPFGLWLRTGLPETLHAEEPAASRTAARGHAVPPPITARSSTGPRRSRLARRHWRVIALAVLILASATIGTYIFTYVVTYAQHTLRLSARAGFVAELVSYAVSLPIVVLGGRLSDRHGRRPINVWSNLVFLCAIYPVFAWIAAKPSEGSLIAGITLLSVPSSLWSGSFFAALAEALPRAVRSSSFGTVYSISIALFGGTTQLVVTWLIHLTGNPLAPAWYLIGAAAVGQVALMLYPETAPAPLSRGYRERRMRRRIRT
jgi:MFS family permease